MTRNRIFPALLGVIATAAFAVPALAQNRAAPPTPPASDPPGAVVYLYYAIIILLGGATIAVSVMPGKRSHQD